MTRYLLFVIHILINFSLKAQTNFNIYYYTKYPFAYTDTLGQLKGLDIEMVQKLAQYIGKKENQKITLQFIEYNSPQYINGLYNALDSNSIILPDYDSELDSSKFIYTIAYRKNIYTAVSDEQLMPIDKLFKKNKINLLKNRMIILQNESANHFNNLSASRKLDSSNKTLISKNVDTIIALTNTGQKFFSYCSMVDLHRIQSNSGIKLNIHKAFQFEGLPARFILPKSTRLKQKFDLFLDPQKGYLSTQNYEKLLQKYLTSIAAQ